jgi:ABC-2 type transport system ATP-binding protein
MNANNLEIRGLRAGYGSRVVINDIALAIGRGEWFALVGPNGCGKSTLLDCVAGRLVPVSGDIRIAGYSLFEDSSNAKRQLGYACAPEKLPGLLTARQCLEIHAGAKGLAAIDAELFKLAEDLRFGPHLEAFVDTLSLGTCQKLSVLLALVGDPKLIVLDEAFNGLDPASALVLKRHLRTRIQLRGASVLLATHALDIVERQADRAGLLIDGRFTREWDTAELAQLRASGQGFENALAATL